MEDVEQPGMTEVKYPSARFNVISAIEALADPVHQRERWGVYDEVADFYDDLDMNIHILYDDFHVLPDAAVAVGTVLLPDEVAPMERLDRALGPMLKELGDVPDRTYMDDPRWPEVIEAARAALAVMGGTS